MHGMLVSKVQTTLEERAKRMYLLIVSILLTVTVVSGIATESDPEIQDLPLAVVRSKIAIDILTETSTTSLGPFTVSRRGVSISRLDGTRIALVDSVQAEDSTIASMIRPVAFSPNGKRISLSASQGSRRVYVLDDNKSKPVCATCNQVARVEGTGNYIFNHEAVAWSPDSKRLAIFTQIHDESMVSVFEHDSLQTIYRFAKHERAGSKIPMAWSADGSTLFIAPYLGPKRWQLIRLPMRNGEPEIILEEEESIGSLVWSPSYDTMAFNVGASLWLFDGKEKQMVFTAPWPIGSMSWSIDGSRLALSEFLGHLLVITRNGADSWNVTDQIKRTGLIRNVEWLDKDRFAFILTTVEEPESTMLFVGNVSTKRVSRLPTGNIASTQLKSVAGGILYFNVLDYGPWVKRERSRRFGSGGSHREVRLGLSWWNLEDSLSIRLSDQVFVTGESTQNTAAYFPAFWVPPDVKEMPK